MFEARLPWLQPDAHGMRWTTLTKFPAAFSGRNRLSRAPVVSPMNSISLLDACSKCRGLSCRSVGFRFQVRRELRSFCDGSTLAATVRYEYAR